MRVELERSGGFVGRTVRWQLDTADLPPGEAEEVQALLTGAESWTGPPAPGADRFLYRLKVLDAERPIDVSFGEPGPAAAQPLLDRLTSSEGRRQP